MIWVIDFEGNRRCGIVEYGLVGLQGGRVVVAHTRVCRPRQPLDPREARLTGLIGSAIPERAGAFDQEWNLFRNARRSGPFAAHHATVEDNLLRDAWPVPGEVPDFSRPGSPVSSSWGPWLDSRVLALHAFPDLPDYSLGAVVVGLGLQSALDDLARKHCPQQRRSYHAALYDALASALILVRAAESLGVPVAEAVRLFRVMRHGESPEQTRFFD